MVIPPVVRFGLACFVLYVYLPLYLGNLLFGVPGLLTVAMGLLTGLFWYGEAPRHAYPNIPGPPAKWLIGNLDMFIKLGGYHRCYEQVVQQYGRVARVQMGSWPQIVLQDPALIKEVALDKFDAFRDRKIGFSLRKNKGLLLSRGDEWHRSRRVLNPAFNSIKLSAFCPTIARHCQALTQRLDRFLEKKTGEAIEVLALFGDLTMDVIGSTSFDAEFGLQQCPLGEGGEPVHQGESESKDTKQKDVLEAAKNIFMSSAGPLGSGSQMQMFVTIVMPFLGPLFKLLFPFLLTPQARVLLRSIRKLDSITNEILEGRSQFNTASPDESSSPKSASRVDANFIDLVRKAQDPDSGIALDSDEVRDQLNLFVLAGYETTANTLAYTTFLLAQHPEVEAKMVEEILRLAPNKDAVLTFKDLTEFTYLNNIINESLRLYPPGAMLSREALRDVTIGSGKQLFVVSKGTWMIIPVYSLHRDELFWENPLQFQPERFEDATKLTKYAHLPFGIGPRNCIGQRFALEEIKLALIALYRDHTFRLHQKTELPLELKAGITLSAANGIWMTVHRRGEAVAGEVMARD